MIKFLPYTAVDGIATFQDSFIKRLYERMEAEGLVPDYVFYDGNIQSADDFLHRMKHNNILTVIEFKGEIAGLFWLNNFEMRKAEFHFCFFNNLRGADALQVGEKVRYTLMNLTDGAGAPLYDLLYGLTEVANIAAQKWCERLGFKLLGLLPSALWNARQKKSVPAYFWYVERGDGENG